MYYFSGMKLVLDTEHACEDTTGETAAQSLEEVVNRPHNAAPKSVGYTGSVLFLEPLSEAEALKELFYDPSAYAFTDIPHKLNQYFIPSYRSNPFYDDKAQSTTDPGQPTQTPHTRPPLLPSVVPPEAEVGEVPVP